ncbi:MAG: IGHMBP2 family helicase, partial [Planctomycetota bacterium]|nr:IGHMBP2 family helicase [Planctomycetota bacterium]
EIVDEDTGLGGRFLVQLMKRKRAPLPWTRLGVGSPVILSPNEFVGRAAPRSEQRVRGGAPHQGEAGYRGVVYARDESSLRVALGSEPEDVGEHDAWRVDLSHDEIAVQRQRAALQRVRAARGDRLADLRDVLLGQRPPEFNPVLDEPALDTDLNATQLAAVEFALSARDLALIHGPPGTGKTTTVVEVIRRAVQRGCKVLACAPSNMAVDNIFERLLAAGTRAVRLGHPARVLPELRSHTLDLLVGEHPDVRLARRLVKEARALFRKASRFTRAKPEPGVRQEARQEAKSLLNDARRLESQAADQILDTAQVLCATTTGLDSEVLGTRRFDLAVIDEACQSVEPGCWIPLLRCERVVLAGDHCQLPPTVVSREAAAAGFGVSLFERLMTLYGPLIARRLTVQYRMHTAIMDFSSWEFYDAELEADASVREHLLRDLPGVSLTPLTETPVEFLDTAGAGFEEEDEPDGESRLNPREAELICRQVQALLEAGLPAASIGVITPYAAQVRWLREQLPVRGLEVDSVDGFQGREKEAVLISLVRSNPRGEIGFLSDVRRMNVALTRARRKLWVVGDSATLSAHPFYQRLIEYFEQIGAYRTVWDADV